MVKVTITEQENSFSVETAAAFVAAVRPQDGKGESSKLVMLGQATKAEIIAAVARCAASMIKTLGEDSYSKCLMIRDLFVRQVDDAMKNSRSVTERCEITPARQDVVHWND